jgi:SlyX protein
MATDTDARLIALEVNVSHQAQTIDEMSAVIAEQWKTIEHMQRKLEALASRFVAIEDQDGAPPENTKPPHW